MSATPDAAARWERITELFHEALERDASARAAFLDAACGGDAGLRRDVASLLDAHDRPGPIGPTDDEPSPPLEWIGPYRLLRPIGEGGMGMVYLAERSGEGFMQTVALKLIRAGYRDPRLAERLESERAILARLEHPGIARLIDGGTTSAGQPYYAMEFIEGETVLDHTRGQGLSLRRRLRLFLSICDALHYAHQQLVVHRDIKPGNIIVTADGRPKLLDFGIAKLLESSERDETQTSPWITPAYAAPEQLRDGRVSTLTDVYALGVLLYELVAGCRPYDVRDLPPARLEEVVCEEIPPLPSQALVGTAGHAPAADRLRRHVAGDLDAIVMKALAKDPVRRYQSVEQLADDLRRWLDGRPVIARPDSVAYRARLFVRRNRVTVAAAAAALLVVVGGAGVAVWQARVASRARDRAEAALRQSQDVTAFLLGMFEASDPDAAFGDTVAAREILRRGVAEADRLADQPVVQARLLDALGQIYERLGRYEDAERLLRQAWTRRRSALGAEHLEIAQSLDHLGSLSRRLGRYPEADSLLRQSLAMKERLVGPDHAEVAATVALLGFLMPYMGRSQEAVTLYQRALAIRERVLPPGDPALTANIVSLASLSWRAGRYDDAEQLYRDALRRRQQYGADDLLVADAKVNLADFLIAVRDRVAEADTLLNEALAAMRGRLGPRHNRMIHGIGVLARVAEREDRMAVAESLYQEGVAIRRTAMGPRNTSVAGGLAELGDFLERHRRWSDAAAVFREAMDIWSETLGPDHPTVAGAMAGLAKADIGLGRYNEADSLFREVHVLRERAYGPNHTLLALGLAEHAGLERRRRHYPEAEAMALRALGILTQSNPDAQVDVQVVLAELVNLYEDWGRPEETERYRRRLVPERRLGPF